MAYKVRGIPRACEEHTLAYTSPSLRNTTSASREENRAKKIRVSFTIFFEHFSQNNVECSPRSK